MRDRIYTMLRRVLFGVIPASCILAATPAAFCGEPPLPVMNRDAWTQAADENFAGSLRIPASSQGDIPGAAPVFRDAPAGDNPKLRKVMIIILENTAYQTAAAQPFMSYFAGQGALLTNLEAETHPSQGNYIALTAGDYYGVTTDKPVNLDVRHIANLLEARGLTWKVYAQGYPGGCYLGAKAGNYVRKHVPFLSYTGVQKDPGECANIVADSELKRDIAAGRLPEFSLFIPDIRNDGHDTGAAYADKWLASYFGPLMKDPAFMKDMLLVITFDEDDKSTSENRVYTALYGPAVAPGSVSDAGYTHYSLLRTIEDGLKLGTLGRNDASAPPITGIWNQQ